MKVKRINRINDRQTHTQPQTDKHQLRQMQTQMDKGINTNTHKKMGPTETDTDRELQMETDRDKKRGTDEDREKETDGDRDRHTETGTERPTQQLYYEMVIYLFIFLLLRRKGKGESKN